MSEADLDITLEGRKCIESMILEPHFDFRQVALPNEFCQAGIHTPRPRSETKDVDMALGLSSTLIGCKCMSVEYHLR